METQSIDIAKQNSKSRNENLLSQISLILRDTPVSKFRCSDLVIKLLQALTTESIKFSIS